MNPREVELETKLSREALEWAKHASPQQLAAWLNVRKGHDRSAYARVCAAIRMAHEQADRPHLMTLPGLDRPIVFTKARRTECIAVEELDGSPIEGTFVTFDETEAEAIVGIAKKLGKDRALEAIRHAIEWKARTPGARLRALNDPPEEWL